MITFTKGGEKNARGSKRKKERKKLQISHTSSKRKRRVDQGQLEEEGEEEANRRLRKGKEKWKKIRGNPIRKVEE